MRFDDVVPGQGESSASLYTRKCFSLKLGIYDVAGNDWQS
jgi:hypothetical protein